MEGIKDEENQKNDGNEFFEIQKDVDVKKKTS